MFSMKYTSPKVPPKKMVSSPTLDPMYSDHECNERKAVEKGKTSANGPINEASSLGRYRYVASASAKAKPSNADLTDSDDSENDSAVANISQEMEPRSNLIALLDREYVSGSSSGEGFNDRNRSTDDASNKPAAVTGYTEGEEMTTSTFVHDQNIKDMGAFDRQNTIGARLNLLSSKPASMNLPVRFSLHETVAASDEYLRSCSMEPLFEVQPEDSTLTASSIEGDSVEVAVFGQSRSILSSWESEADSKGREFASIIDRPPIAGPSSSMSTQPSSPMMSEVNFDGRNGISTRGHPSSEATETDIGGDTYFDQPSSCNLDLEVEKPRADIIEDDFLLPPRVNRTSSSSNDNTPFLPEKLFPRSPRQPFAHAHSLLDDCSDDDDEEDVLFTIVDSPTRHFHSYSCLPRARATSEPSRNKSHRATKVANDNIQQVLLQTRHRRWNCQSAYAGSHAQSNQVFDISHRAHYVVGDLSENEHSSLAARLSVSVEAIRAAALASGLWRTVRLVRLPHGLLLSHSALELKDDESVWALLSMLGATFPLLSEIDFAGDVFRVSDGPDERCPNNDGWRKEVLAFIMKCLPNIVAIDGCAVDVEANWRANRRGPCCANISVTASNMKSSLCKQGEKNLVETSSRVECEDPVGLLNTGEENEMEKSTRKVQNGLSDDSVDMVECVSANIMLEVQDKHETLATEGTDSVDEEMKTLPNLSSCSMLSSSQSWGSNNSGRRPPTCPSSASRHRPRLATKPADRKRANGPSRSGLKRRVLGLIPAVSMMDEDDDEDSEGSEC